MKLFENYSLTQSGMTEYSLHIIRLHYLYLDPNMSYKRHWKCINLSANFVSTN